MAAVKGSVTTYQIPKSVNPDPRDKRGPHPYSPAEGSLFGRTNEPKYWDVQQGEAGDCWLLASLAEVASRAPQDIKSMFTYDGTKVENGSVVGEYTVRYYSYKTDQPEYVTVDTELPDGGNYYHRTVNYSNGTSVLWAALAEKAYAEANGDRYVQTLPEHEGKNSYAALDGGFPSSALQAITGDKAEEVCLNPTHIRDAYWNGDLVVYATPKKPAGDYIACSHAYAIIKSAPFSDSFTVYNPWGVNFKSPAGNGNFWAPGKEYYVYGVYNADAAFMWKHFTYPTIGTP